MRARLGRGSGENAASTAYRSRRRHPGPGRLLALLRPRRRRWRRGPRLARPDRRRPRQTRAAGLLLLAQGRPKKFALAMAAEHAFREDAPRRPLARFGLLLILRHERRNCPRARLSGAGESLGFGYVPARAIEQELERAGMQKKMSMENPFCFAGQISRYLARGEDHGTIDERGGDDTQATSSRSPPPLAPRTRRHSISHTVTAGKGGCDDPLPLMRFL